ncbi:MAG TPA: hypothetical protein DCR39_00545 [Nitrospiraceae bacterium]|nr:hypothetical protein [Nitrospiraceae bacterium]
MARNPASKHLYPIYKHFFYGDLPESSQVIGRLIADLADIMMDELPDGPEKAEGFRKLLEAKDCFIRAGLKIQ